MSSPVELIKEKLDIVEFLRGYVQLHPAGKNFKALCPFHKEKTPSFMISPDRGTWRCFGCSAGGDVFSFLMKHENVEFYEALKILAEKAGVELKRVNPAEYKQTGLIFELNEKAKEFFRDALKESDVARKYLAERGLTEETLEEFEIGFAPNDREALSLHLLDQGYVPDDIIRAGLAFKTERGLQIDRFRGRIMFPIHNHFGKTAGFSGRILPQLDDGASGKYINSPETQIFVKSKILYGFFRTKASIKESGIALLVEGQMDMLMCYQAGVRNVAATSGTALTLDHLRTLRRFAETLVISFDNDEAGFAAGERAIDLAEANDFSVKVLLMPRGEASYKDPADIAKESPELLQKLVKDAKPAPEFYFERYIGVEKNAAPHRDPEFKKNLRIVLSKLARMASPVDRSFWMRELAKRTGIDEKALIEEAERVGRVAPVERSAATEEAPREIPIARWELLSQHLLAIGLAKGDFGDIHDHTHYLSHGYAELYELLKSGARSSRDAAQDALIDTVVLLSGVVGGENVAELKDYLAEEYRRERRRALTLSLKDAETRGNEAETLAVLEEMKTYF